MDDLVLANNGTVGMTCSIGDHEQCDGRLWLRMLGRDPEACACTCHPHIHWRPPTDE